MQVRASYHGTGGELFKKLFVGFLLTGITLGLYGPWFIVDFQKYMYEKTTIHGTAAGDIKISFIGTGGQLFMKLFVGYLLTMITIGIYGFWFIIDMTKFYADNSVGNAEDGQQYRLSFDGTGGQFFGKLFVGYLLLMITLGIYTPWFICKIQKYFNEHTEIQGASGSLGRFDFKGEGGALFGQFLVGMILTMLTGGIYMAWFQVNLQKFFTGNTTVAVGDKTFVGEYTGTGGQWFMIMFVGYLLTLITFGIYSFWWMTNQIRYQTDHSVMNLQA